MNRLDAWIHCQSCSWTGCGSRCYLCKITEGWLNFVKHGILHHSISPWQMAQLIICILRPCIMTNVFSLFQSCRYSVLCQSKSFRVQFPNVRSPSNSHTYILFLSIIWLLYACSAVRAFAVSCLNNLVVIKCLSVKKYVE
jgi:hypothetical protein